MGPPRRFRGAGPVLEAAASGPEGTAPEGAGHREHGEGAGNHERGTAGEKNAPSPAGDNPVSIYLLVGIGVPAARTTTAAPTVLHARGQASET